MICKNCRFQNTDNCIMDEIPESCIYFEQKIVFERGSEISYFDKQLCNYYVMAQMRKRFGSKRYNAEHLFPDPRIKKERTQTRKLRR